MPRNTKGHRQRASVIVIDKENRRFLMMYRRKKTQKGFAEKFVVPGGGIARAESLEQAAVREIKEETTLDVTIDHKITTIKYPNCDDHVFVATQFSGEPQLAGEEAKRSSKDNYYEPRWISIDEIDTLKIPIYPKPLVPLIKEEF